MKMIEEDDRIAAWDVQKRGGTMNNNPAQNDGSIEGFADPSEEIVAYAQSHDIHLNLRSKIVQRVLRLRMHTEERTSNKSGQEERQIGADPLAPTLGKIARLNGPGTGDCL
jgi:hypothetical protein